MLNIADRIKFFRLRANMTQGQLAEACGWGAQSRIGNYESSRRIPPIPEAMTIAHVLGITLDELVSDHTPTLLKRPCYEYPRLTWPEYESFLAGNPLAEDIPTEVTHHCSIGQAFWLPLVEDTLNCVTGLSLCAGSLMLVDTQSSVESGALVVARLSEQRGLTVRKLVKDAGISYLRTLNPAYATISQEGAFDVLGVVVESKLIL